MQEGKECAIASNPQDSPCPPLNPFQAIGADDYDAVRSDLGQAAAPIDVLTRCRYVDNASADKSAFVPFKSESEWNAFIAGYPGYISLATCARPMTANLAPSENCADPSPASQAVSLPYARTGTVLAKNATFACAPPEDGCPGWTQTVENTFTALNSDVDNPSWLAGSPQLSGQPAGR